MVPGETPVTGSLRLNPHESKTDAHRSILNTLKFTVNSAKRLSQRKEPETFAAAPKSLTHRVDQLPEFGSLMNREIHIRRVGTLDVVSLC